MQLDYHLRCYKLSQQRKKGEQEKKGNTLESIVNSLTLQSIVHACSVDLRNSAICWNSKLLSYFSKPPLLFKLGSQSAGYKKKRNAMTA